MEILFLSRWFPYPPSNGSKIRIYNLLRGLAQHHTVTLLSFADTQDVDANAPALRTFCRDVQVVPWQPFQPHSPRARFAFFSLSPRFLIDTFSREMASSIQELIARRRFDLVVASQISMASYRSHFRGLPALFEEVEIGVPYERYSQASSPIYRLRHGLTWMKHGHYLRGLLRRFDACTVVSERERALLSMTVPGYSAIEVVPNCVQLADYAHVYEPPRPNTLIFTGSFSYFPNHEAMVWFLKTVYPRVLEQVPGAHLTITGDSAGQPLPNSANLIQTGFVDDVRPLVARSWISIVPLHTGGGTRLKIVEAMALGTTVVATSKGAEGLDVRHGEHLLIADTPEAFTQAVVRLLREPGLRQELATRAYDLVGAKYDWTRVLPHFLHIAEKSVEQQQAMGKNGGVRRRLLGASSNER